MQLVPSEKVRPASQLHLINMLAGDDHSNVLIRICLTTNEHSLKSITPRNVFYWSGFARFGCAQKFKPAQPFLTVIYHIVKRGSLFVFLIF